jgi:hypothetical protein
LFSFPLAYEVLKPRFAIFGDEIPAGWEAAAGSHDENSIHPFQTTSRLCRPEFNRIAAHFNGEHVATLQAKSLPKSLRENDAARVIDLNCLTHGSNNTIWHPLMPISMEELKDESFELDGFGNMKFSQANISDLHIKESDASFAGKEKAEFVAPTN